MTTTLAAAMLAALLSAAPGTSPSEALTRARVNAFLGADGTTAEEWKQLDATAVPFLKKVIDDLDEAPARRMRAMSALTLLGSRNDLRQLMELGRNRRDQTAVRLVALRLALPRFSRAEATAHLRPLLKDPQALQIRLLAADRLIRFSRISGCTAVRAQVARERSRDQELFERALARCPPPAEPAGEAAAEPPP